MKEIKLYLVGFNTDYQKSEIESLSKKYNVIDCSLPTLIYYIFDKLVLKNARAAKFIIEVFYKIYFSIISIDESDVILVIDDPVDILAINVFSRYRCGVIFRNTYNDKMSFLLDFDNIKLFSFDKKDCKKYGFILYNQYLPNESLFKKETDIIYDIFFIGLDKGRGEYLKKIENYLLCNNVKCEILVKQSPKKIVEKIRKYLLKEKKFNFLSYKENIKYVCKSKCILEITKKGQDGITLRALEAIFSGRKLITNNKDVINYSFYNEDYIYILSDELEDNDNLIKFINSPIKFKNILIPEEYTVTYVFENIINRIISE